jgi:hypothetical protein
MSEESVVRDLFDRSERVCHEGRYDLVADCMAQVYIRHKESGTRRVRRTPVWSIRVRRSLLRLPWCTYLK